LVTFAVGFGILFVFLGTFTYVNFALAARPFALGPMTLGYVYFVFLPSIFTTPLAGTVVECIGRRGGLFASLGVAGVGLFCLVAPSLPAVLVGLTLVGVGTFLAQAIATGIVGAAAQGERAAASGMYLASYYLGGLVGTAVLGPVFQTYGWAGCVLGIAAMLCACLGLTALLRPRKASSTPIRA
jgi:MFS family permease